MQGLTVTAITVAENTLMEIFDRWAMSKSLEGQM